MWSITGVSITNRSKASKIHHKRTVVPAVVSREIDFSLQLPVVYGWRHTMISHVSFCLALITRRERAARRDRSVDRRARCTPHRVPWSRALRPLSQFSAPRKNYRPTFTCFSGIIEMLALLLVECDLCDLKYLCEYSV